MAGTEKINIAFVSHFSHMRMGGQRSMAHLIENLNRDKFTPFCICPEPGELSEKLENIGCKCFFVPLYSIKPRYYKYLRPTVKQIKKIILDNNIHILHPDRDADVVYCALAKRKTGAKLIWHVRVNDGNSKDPLNSRWSDGIIGVSDAAGRRFSNSPKIRNKYRTIYNGVNTKLFAPVEDKKALRKQLGLPEDKFILIFVGQVTRGKGIFDLTDALNLLKIEIGHQKMPYVLYIGTYSDDETAELLKNSIAHYKLNDFISLPGQQNNIHEWMQAADALIIPSHEGVEGMPRVLYEAMSCGAAGIGSNTSGVNEAVTENSGLLVDEHSPRDIADKIKMLIENNELLEKLKTNGRKRALEFFDIRKHAEKVEEFYLEILNR